MNYFLYPDSLYWNVSYSVICLFFVGQREYRANDESVCLKNPRNIWPISISLSFTHINTSFSEAILRLACSYVDESIDGWRYFPPPPLGMDGSHN